MWSHATIGHSIILDYILVTGQNLIQWSCISARERRCWLSGNKRIMNEYAHASASAGGEVRGAPGEVEFRRDVRMERACRCHAGRGGAGARGRANAEYWTRMGCLLQKGKTGFSCQCCRLSFSLSKHRHTLLPVRDAEPCPLRCLSCMKCCNDSCHSTTSQKAQSEHLFQPPCGGSVKHVTTPAVCPIAVQ